MSTEVPGALRPAHRRRVEGGQQGDPRLGLCHGFYVVGKQQSGLASEVDLACEDAFGFAGERCERIVARVMLRLAAGEPS